MYFIKRIIFFIKRFFLSFEFKSKDYWELRYSTQGNSGHGSYGKFAQDKSDFINDMISKYDLQSCVEFGCGDGNNLKYYNFKKYLGVDVAQTSIKLCLEQYAADKNKSFMHYDPTLFHQVGQFIDADVALSSEVLFHLVEEDVFKKYLKDLFESANKNVIIISTDHNKNDDSPSHIYHREFSKYVQEMFPNWKKIDLELGDKTEEYGEYFHLYQKP